ncbi:MAG: hypothetical protein HYZ29_05185 [Myxococcales bacterium]|nr:hypothetical protein [Myxococcales bacterium]
MAGLTVALALGATVATARAQAGAPAAGAAFGQRDEFIFSVERLFGFQNQKFDDDSGSYEATGFHPLYWGSVGLFSMSASGLNFGALLGATRYQFGSLGGDSKVNVLQLRPRIGYGGTEKERRFGYWLRGGPSALIVLAQSEDTDASGKTSSESRESYALGVGGEAYVVLFPVPHVGVVVGPHAEFHLVGEGDGDPYYRSYGLTAGVMGEFY